MTSVRERHEVKVLVLISVIPSGRMIDFRFTQLQNAEYPMEVRFFDNVISSRLHASKARSPMDVTVSAIITLSSDGKHANA